MTTDKLPYSTASMSPAGAMIKIDTLASDTVDLPNGPCRSLLVGTAGAATINDAYGQKQVSVPLQQGYNPIGIARLWTGAGASNIWALY